MSEMANMLSLDASKRYVERKDVRKSQLKRIKREGIETVESPERVRNRRKLADGGGVSALEGVIGEANFLDFNYLEIGAQRGRSIGRIDHRHKGKHVQFGTGFMVSPTLLLTNNHVLPTSADAAGSFVEFAFEDDADGIPESSKVFRLDPAKFYHTSPSSELDFTLVAVVPEATDGSSLDVFGFLRLLEDSGKALITEPVTLIHHPRGARKQVSLRDNRMIDNFDRYIHYEADTQGGSSGSPVFNNQWDVVALHHAGIAKLDKKDRWLAKDGRLWKEGMGKDAVDWRANEGVRISQIFAHLNASQQQWTADQQKLYTEMKEGSG